jgi:hypothetical protein
MKERASEELRNSTSESTIFILDEHFLGSPAFLGKERKHINGLIVGKERRGERYLG